MACGNPREPLLPDVHLMLTGLSRRVWELVRGDRDGYACCYVGGESKGRGRLNWTVGRSPSAREPCVCIVQETWTGKGLKTDFSLRFTHQYGRTAFSLDRSSRIHRPHVLAAMPRGQLLRAHLVSPRVPISLASEGDSSHPSPVTPLFSYLHASFERCTRLDIVCASLASSRSGSGCHRA